MVIHPESAALKVLLVGPDPLARFGLSALLREGGGLSVSAELSPGDDLGSACREEGPHALVWDAPEEPPGEAALAGVPVPSLVLVPDERDASRALAAGARSVVRRDILGDALQAAVRATALELSVFDPSFVGHGAIARGSQEHDALTPRELEVLSLLAEGLSNKQIATRLSVSDHTAKFHVNAILQKLSATSRTDAVVKATRRGLLLL